MTDADFQAAFEAGTLPKAAWTHAAHFRVAWFYLGRLPEGQDVHPQPGEVDDWLWVAPETALANPRFTMVFATRRVLEMVAVRVLGASSAKEARMVNEPSSA